MRYLLQAPQACCLPLSLATAGVMEVMGLVGKEIQTDWSSNSDLPLSSARTLDKLVPL